MNFNTSLVSWYHRFKRDLPWRDTRDPYKIWLSEIILQQTRVDQGMAYYQKFVSKYPTAIDLAQASEDEVLKDWQGLGYYSRARNLHFSAKKIASEMDGRFPNTYQNILNLKGVGEYTAAAIASFAFDLPHPVIDGNVMRVLSRFFGVFEPIDSTEGKKKLQELANDNLLIVDPATYNQAIMEFGALQCVPVNPNCKVCPLASGCVAFQKNAVAQLPYKAKKTAVKELFVYYAVIEVNGIVYMKKRSGEGIWEGLYDFPSIECETALERDAILPSFKEHLQLNEKILQVDFSKEYKHILSHRRLKAHFLHIKLSNKWHKMPDGAVEIPWSKITEKGIPRLIEKYLQDVGKYE
jgi:A/G-specific adenine glycosylase